MPLSEAPPADAELTGMGVLPFVWYSGAVPDLELFGDGVPLETDEVASSPDVRCKYVPTHLPLIQSLAVLPPPPPLTFPLFPTVPTRKSPLTVAYGPCFLVTG